MTLAVLILLAGPLPTASAHLARERPRLQDTEEARVVTADMDGLNLTFSLLRASDPVADHVRHEVDPRFGTALVEYRPQQPQREAAFGARWTLDRIFEYRDQNLDGAYSPGSDTIVRSWPLRAYAWTLVGPRDVTVGGVTAKYVQWTGNASGTPPLRIEAVAAGKSFVDEGATAREQDAVLFVEWRGLPPRGTGDLHAIEGRVAPLPGGTASLDTGANGTAGLRVDAPGRLALFDWGGSAEVDGEEARVTADLDPARPDASRVFRINLPLLENRVRLVIVSAIEYEKEDLRAPTAPLSLLVLALGLLAWTRRRA